MTQLIPKGDPHAYFPVRRVHQLSTRVSPRAFPREYSRCRVAQYYKELRNIIRSCAITSAQKALYSNYTNIIFAQIVVLSLSGSQWIRLLLVLAGHSAAYLSGTVWIQANSTHILKGASEKGQSTFLGRSYS